MQYVGIQTQQSRNNLRSAFLLFLFPCLVAALLYLSCYLLVLFGYGKSMEIEIMPMVNHFFLSSLPYTMGIVIIWFLIAYWANTSIINCICKRHQWTYIHCYPLGRYHQKTEWWRTGSSDCAWAKSYPQPWRALADNIHRLCRYLLHADRNHIIYHHAHTCTQQQQR